MLVCAVVALSLFLGSCTGKTDVPTAATPGSSDSAAQHDQNIQHGQEEKDTDMDKTTQIEITVNGSRKLDATFEDNATTRALIARMPFTITMDNLYSREMCHRYGHGALPVDDARDRGYEVGDISYWPPMGSLVFLYRQNGEIFEQQPIGHIDGDVSFFGNLSSAEVAFSVKE